MKIAIIYYSKHHNNTKKILDELCKENEITLINSLDLGDVNLSEYDAIGFASGIYYSKFHKSVLKAAKNNLPENKKVFYIYTYGAKKDGYTKAVNDIASKKSAEVLGEFGCSGFDTFGPFGLIGGIAKGHPSDEDCRNAVDFFNNVIKKNCI